VTTCVVGAGSIGSLYAAHLARVGESAVLTRRPEHAAALRSEGLRVSGHHEFTARVVAAANPNELPEPQLVIIATKATGLESAAAAIEGHWPNATVMTVQNGLGAEDFVRRHGAWQIVSGVTFMSGTKHSDTHVEYILDTETWVGPWADTPYERAQEVASLLAAADLEAEALPDLRPAQWSKLIFNATVNGVAALTGLPHDWHFAAENGIADLGHLVHDLVDEGKRIAAAAGVELHDDPWEMNVLATRRGSLHYPSMLEDVDARRPTEVELIGGALVREARKHGVDAPLHTALYRLVKAKEASYTEPELKTAVPDVGVTEKLGSDASSESATKA
jgi:2-dehydropantoate 2-reductase